ncbi:MULTISPECIES: hypothetical protein [Cysteiniphilum]|uniref:Uncharacterized protein n=1 Tax=Cysteiniphilum litorale TaxID=2056700 RepID=A0A8J3E7S7_9GAMM|nr:MULTISPECIES: hypothetical protein [Cysteiniphilum]GGF92796.1 hypothetical protein GCM10010995_07450 [Cysteiniphilum litorale]
MCTIFHAGRKVLRQEIGNHNHAEIADLLFFRVQGTKYYDDDGKPFFLLPNINYISEETGFKERSCERALADLDKNNWIDRVKIKCYDGAVRTKIYITDKFRGIMEDIDQLLNNDKKIYDDSKKEYRKYFSGNINDTSDNSYNKEAIDVSNIVSDNNKSTELNECSDNNQSNDAIESIEQKLKNIELSRTLLNNLSNSELVSLSNNKFDSAIPAESDSANLAESYIKEKTIKEENNNYNKYQEPECLDDQISQIVKSVNLVFTYDLEKMTEEAEQTVINLAKQSSLDFISLFDALVELQEAGIYHNQIEMINDAIKIELRKKGDNTILPTGDKRLKYKKAIFEAEDKRRNTLTPRQHIAIIQTLKWLESTGQAVIGCINEVYAWIEYQLSNPDFHFQGKGFKHCLSIIKKMLCNTGKRQYSKPYGYV